MKRIFADDWRDCLREQFKYVIRQQDHRTQATLLSVLYEVGFTDDELDALRLEATMRAEDMPDDYVPDAVRQSYAGVDVPEAAAEVVEDEDEDNAPEPEAPATYDELIEQVEEVVDEDVVDEAPEEPEDDEDSPQQMSMF
jgi:hypothetical protein